MSKLGHQITGSVGLFNYKVHNFIQITFPLGISSQVDHQK